MATSPFNALGAKTLSPTSEFGALTEPRADLGGEFAPFGGDITSAPAVTFDTPDNRNLTQPINPGSVRTEAAAPASFNPVNTSQIRPAASGLGSPNSPTPAASATKVPAGPTGSSEGNLGGNRALGSVAANLTPQLMRHLFSVLAARRRTAV